MSCKKCSEFYTKEIRKFILWTGNWLILFAKSDIASFKAESLALQLLTSFPLLFYSLAGNYQLSNMSTVQLQKSLTVFSSPYIRVPLFSFCASHITHIMMPYCPAPFAISSFTNVLPCQDVVTISDTCQCTNSQVSVGQTL